VGHHGILCQLANVADVTVHNFYDNTATVFLQWKGAAMTVGPAVYLLLLQALHQRHYRCAPLYDYIYGGVNLMADVTTRSWELSNNSLRAHFECHFPQTLPWTLCKLQKPMSSALTSALLSKRYAPELLFNEPKPKTSIGRGGTIFSSRKTLTHSYASGKTLSQSSKYLEIAKETDDLPPSKIPSELKKWRTQYVRSARR
jgi:hypothetical protein